MRDARTRVVIRIALDYANNQTVSRPRGEPRRRKGEIERCRAIGERNQRCTIWRRGTLRYKHRIASLLWKGAALARLATRDANEERKHEKYESALHFRQLRVSFEN